MSKLVDIRSFNDKGILQFVSFIRETRNYEDETGQLILPPIDLLDDPKCLSNRVFGIEINLEKIFPNRYEFAVYLTETFGDKFKETWYEDHGLWAWLALAYFEQLRNKKLRTVKGGRFATQHEANFISDKWRKSIGRPKWYRQSVATPFVLVKRFGERAKFLLNPNGMEKMGDIIEQILSDPKIMSSEKLLSLIFEKYSGKDGFAKPGTGAYSSPAKAKSGSKAGYGKLRRLTDDFLPRIKLTHDIDFMETKEIISVCGKEFQ